MRTLIGLSVAAFLGVTSAYAADPKISTQHCGDYQQEIALKISQEKADGPTFLGVFDGYWKVGKDKMAHTLVIYDYKQYDTYGEVKGLYAISAYEKFNVPAGCWGFTGQVKNNKMTVRFDAVAATATYKYDKKRGTIAAVYLADGQPPTPGVLKRIILEATKTQ